MQGLLWACPSVSASVTTSARQRISWGRRARGEVVDRAGTGNNYNWRLGGEMTMEEVGQGGPGAPGDEARRGVPSSPPPWRIWAPREQQGPWRKEMVLGLGPSHCLVLIPAARGSPSPTHPLPSPPARCPVPTWKVSP